MTRFVLAPEAEFDIAAILNYLKDEAGLPTAEYYRRRILHTIGRLRAFPGSGAPRPAFGAFTRIAVVHPYVLFYDYVPSDDLLTLLRVLHGKSDVAQERFGR